MQLLLRIVINAAALIVASKIVPNIVLPKELLAVGAIALIFAVINSLLKPIVRLLALPVRIATLGLVGLLINAGMLLVLAWVSGLMNLGFSISGFPPDFSLNAIVTAVLAGIIVSIVAAILSRFLDRE